MEKVIRNRPPRQERNGDPLAGCERGVGSLRAIGAEFHGRGWSLGTSSNYSVVISRSPLELLVTASGKDKGRLLEGDFVRVDDAGCPLVSGQPKSSAETMLHVALARHPRVGAVLHTHSIWGTLVSDHFFPDGGLVIEGYEMLKGLSGVTTHEHREWVEIFDNTQNIADLALRVAARFSGPGEQPGHGFLIRRHGLYTWGEDLAEARRHVEIFEFLLECIGRSLTLKSEHTRSCGSEKGEKVRR
jgi:methylthioribulose-1-phosphate dehydratase